MSNFKCILSEIHNWWWYIGAGRRARVIAQTLSGQLHKIRWLFIYLLGWESVFLLRLSSIYEYMCIYTLLLLYFQHFTLNQGSSRSMRMCQIRYTDLLCPLPRYEKQRQWGKEENSTRSPKIKQSSSLLYMHTMLYTLYIYIIHIHVYILIQYIR